MTRPTWSSTASIYRVPRRAHRHPEHARHRLLVLRRHRGVAGARPATAGGDCAGESLVDRGHPGELRIGDGHSPVNHFHAVELALASGRDGAGARATDRRTELRAGWRSTSSPIRSRPTATSWPWSTMRWPAASRHSSFAPSGCTGGRCTTWPSQLRERCRAAGVLFFVNDRVDVAMAADADGVHVGVHDLAAAGHPAR